MNVTHGPKLNLPSRATTCCATADASSLRKTELSTANREITLQRVPLHFGKHADTQPSRTFT